MHGPRRAHLPARERYAGDAGHSWVISWISDDILLADDGTVDLDATEGVVGAVGLVEGKRLDGAVYAAYMRAWAEIASSDACVGIGARPYCDADGDVSGIAAYGAQSADAVLAYAKAMHRLLASGGGAADVADEPDALYRALLGLSAFEGVGGPVRFSEAGDRLGFFDVTNLQVVESSAAGRRLHGTSEEEGTPAEEGTSRAAAPPRRGLDVALTTRVASWVTVGSVQISGGELAISIELNATLVFSGGGGEVPEDTPPSEPSTTLLLLVGCAGAAAGASALAAVVYRRRLLKRFHSLANERALKRLGEKLAADKCTFFFVSAAKLRALDGLPAGQTSLPPFQQLRALGDGWLVERSLHLMTRRTDGSVVDRWWELNRQPTWLAISHRWEAPGEPDGKGMQLAAIREHLRRRPEIELVWYDYWCMPQGEHRTPEEVAEFQVMLQNVNLLYICLEVLILLDLTYFSRFWTLLEAWLAMRLVTDKRNAPPAASRMRGAVREWQQRAARTLTRARRPQQDAPPDSPSPPRAVVSASMVESSSPPHRKPAPLRKRGARPPRSPPHAGEQQGKARRAQPNKERKGGQGSGGGGRPESSGRSVGFAVVSPDADAPAPASASSLTSSARSAAWGGVARCTIMPIHNANTVLAEALINMWQDLTVEAAIARLERKDVLVTNQGDKDVQLGKLRELAERARATLTASAKRLFDENDEVMRSIGSGRKSFGNWTSSSALTVGSGSSAGLTLDEPPALPPRAALSPLEA